MRPVPVFCLPYAGAGATFYRPWRPADDAGLTVVALQPAGREERFVDPLYENIDEAVDDLEKQLSGVDDDVSPVLFGHSFGAVLAFELARRLERSGIVPSLVAVSGSAHPGLPLERRSAGVDDDDFVARVRDLAGYSHPALDDPDMREIVLPAMRRDVELHETYVPVDRTPLSAPIAVFRGRDDHLVSTEECSGWAEWTTGGVVCHEFEGGHMYLADDEAPVLAAIARAVARFRVVEAAR